MNVTLFVFADVIKDPEKGVSLDLPGWTLNLMTGILIRDRRKDPDKKLRSHDDRARG